MAEANDPHSVPFAPPKIPVEVHCLHCGNTYMSSEMHFVPRIGEPLHEGDLGDWVCAAPGCDACGFGFDILPTDPDYHDEVGGWMECDEDYDEELENSQLEGDESGPLNLSDGTYDPSGDWDAADRDPVEESEEGWSPAYLDWLDRSGYPFARRWNMVFHFQQWKRRSSHPAPRRDDGRPWEDDIPF